MLLEAVRRASFESAAVPVSFCGMYAVTYLNRKGVFGGQPIEKTARKNDSFLRPDPFTFYTVWPAIYGFTLIFSVAQLAPAEHIETALRQKCAITGLSVRMRLCSAFFMNGLWSIANSHENRLLTTPLMYGMLGMFLSSYSDYNAVVAKSLREGLTLTAGPSMFSSWITCASVLTAVADVGTSFGSVEREGPVGSFAACAPLVAGIVGFGCYRLFSTGDFAWAAVAAYAARGIYRRNILPEKRRKPEAMDANLGYLAQGGAYLLISAMIWRSVYSAM